VHYSYSVAKTALSAGFEPDVISTDLTRISMFEKSVFGLPLIMSKYLNLGMALQNIVKACTDTPARLLRMQGKLGCLTAGAFGDVAVFKLKTMFFDHRDNFDEVLHFNQVIVPMLTVLKGKVAYRSLEI
jgi:dihydroorotase